MPPPIKNRVLVVDDDESIRELFTLLLRKEGYEVTAAENGFDGLLKLKLLVPDVIISDLNMPKMSGSEMITSGTSSLSLRKPSKPFSAAVTS